jgi:hypothetical protein
MRRRKKYVFLEIAAPPLEVHCANEYCPTRKKEQEARKKSSISYNVLRERAVVNLVKRGKKFSILLCHNCAHVLVPTRSYQTYFQPVRTGFRFELVCSRYEYPAVKANGFHWDYQKRVAWTGLTDIARKYEKYSDSKAKEKFGKEQALVQLSRAVNLSDISSEDYEIPVPEGLEYLAFQKAGIVIALSRFGFDISTLKKK